MRRRARLITRTTLSLRVPPPTTTHYHVLVAGIKKKTRAHVSEAYKSFRVGGASSPCIPPSFPRESHCHDVTQRRRHLLGAACSRSLQQEQLSPARPGQTCCCFCLRTSRRASGGHEPEVDALNRPLFALLRCCVLSVCIANTRGACSPSVTDRGKMSLLPVQRLLGATLHL